MLFWSASEIIFKKNRPEYTARFIFFLFFFFFSNWHDFIYYSVCCLYWVLFYSVRALLILINVGFLFNNWDFFFPVQGEEPISSYTSKGLSPRSPLPQTTTPISAPLCSGTSPNSPKTIFPYRQDSPPKSPHRLSFSGFFRSPSNPSSIKIFSKSRKGEKDCKNALVKDSRFPSCQSIEKRNVICVTGEPWRQSAA